MSWTNLYQPPRERTISELYGPEPYDVNFPFSVNLPSLENKLVKITPFIPRVHMATFWAKLAPALDDLMYYLPWDVRTMDDFLRVLEEFRANTQWVVFAVVDKTRPAELDLPGALAGMIGLLNTLPEHRATEIGAMLTLPMYQRSFVTSNAIGLLLHYCLEPAPRGLGLRRVAWQANTANVRSIAAATRLGFREEGVMRWQRILPAGKAGNAPSKDDPVQRPGRDSMMLSVCWDDRESGVCEVAGSAMELR